MFNFNKTFFKLSISDLRIWVHLGCTDQEKFHAQLVSFTIDLVFKAPPKAIASDRLEDTACYFKIVQDIKSLCQRTPFNLIERLTADVYKAIDVSLGDQKSLISFINVTTHKIAPPVQDVHGGVSFTYCDAPSKVKEP